MDTRRTSFQSFTKKVDSNASLWLDKFIAGQDRKGERIDSSADKFKHQLINEVSTIKTPDIYKNFFDRWKDSLTAVGAKFKNFKVEGRMVVGLGAESVLETSIALHRTYGVPFIAGSALKGLAASYADRRLENENWRKGGKAHEFVFGSQDSAGYITFYDALWLPETQNPLHADIMTVHHGDYYGDKNVAPADWDSPVPIPFLSATGNYQAAISSVEGAEDWIEFVWQILEKALQEEGIGAKASSGYGRMKIVKTEAEMIAEQQEQREQRQNLRFESLIEKIGLIKDSSKESKRKFKDVVDSAKRLNFELKNKVAEKIIVKVDELGIGDDLEKNGARWFIEAKKMRES